MKKRIVSMFTAMMLAMSLIAVMPMTVGAEESGDYEYNILDDGTVEITKYNGTETELEIPSVIDDRVVTKIASEAFIWNNRIKDIVLPSSLTSIGEGAFWCTSLENITIPDSVTEIADGAFYSCFSLENISIPEGVTEIADGTFYWCHSLEGITIPDSVTRIGENAFFNSGLSNVTIGKGVTSIEKNAFKACYALQSVTIPDGVESIGNDAFYGCKSLGHITIPKSVTSIGSLAFGYATDQWYSHVRMSDFELTCYADTAGEKYAVDYGFDYVLLDPPTQLSGKVYYQQKNDNQNNIRVIFELAEDDVKSIENTSFKLYIGEELIDSRTLAKAYKSIIAAGKTINAPEGNVFVISPMIENVPDYENVAVSLGMSTYVRSLSRKFNLSGVVIDPNAIIDPQPTEVIWEGKAELPSWDTKEVSLGIAGIPLIESGNILVIEGTPTGLNPQVQIATKQGPDLTWTVIEAEDGSETFDMTDGKLRIKLTPEQAAFLSSSREMLLKGQDVIVTKITYYSLPFI